MLNAVRGIDREPTIHAGYAAMQMDARGAQSDRMDELRGILARNDAIRVMGDEGREARAEDPAPSPMRGAFTARLARAADAPETREPPATPMQHAHDLAGDFKDVLPPEEGNPAPPPRDDRHDPHAEDFERDDERGLPDAPRGARPIGGAVDAISDGIGAMADKAADVMLSLFSSGKEKPVAEDKEQQKGMTAAQAWRQATETSRAANAQREKDIIHEAEKKTHRPLQANERDEALRKGDRER